MPVSVRVTALEQFRIWAEDEDLELGWLLTRLLGKEEPSDVMQAGTAFHAALEHASEGELGTLAFGDYRFDFNCDCAVTLPTLRELAIEKQYGDLLVTGHVDGISGRQVMDYKTTAQFDPDRFMESYQWRFYLDMLDCDTFRWDVFVLSPFGPEHCYEVRQVHQLKQYRYPTMSEDCRQLAQAYSQFAREVLVPLGG